MYYKALTKDRKGPYSDWQWPEPGIWTPEIPQLIRCESGYHVATNDQLIQWLTPYVWEIEVAGNPIEEEDKLIFPVARLVKPTGIFGNGKFEHYLADLAEHVLHIFEDAVPNDPRPRNAIQAARGVGDALAAWDAAGDAAGDAARAAARDAAGAAARAAARDAARDAAWDAARDAERKYQNELLAQYLRGEK